MWCGGVCFFSGDGDVRIGSVSGISSCGCDLDQLEKTLETIHPQGVCGEVLHTTRANLWPDPSKASRGSTEARGIITHPVSIFARSIPPPSPASKRNHQISYRLYLFCFFSPTTPFFFWQVGCGLPLARSGPSFHPAYTDM